VILDTLIAPDTVVILTRVTRARGVKKGRGGFQKTDTLLGLFVVKSFMMVT
jgi:hypothetical protein